MDYTLTIIHEDGTSTVINCSTKTEVENWIVSTLRGKGVDVPDKTVTYKIDFNWKS